MLMKAIKRQFITSGGVPKFTSEHELHSALVKSGFIHARVVGFNDKCLTKACEDFGYPSVSLPLFALNHTTFFTRLKMVIAQLMT